MDHIQTLLFSIALLLPFLFVFLKYFKSQSQQHTLLPPGPKPWPIIGNILHLGKNPHASLAQFAQLHGPLISLQLGSQLLVVGSTPAAATEILKTHDRILASRLVPHSTHVKQPEFNKFSVVWASECNDEWRNLRTLCRNELFSVKAIESQATLKENKVRELVKLLRTKEGKVVKIGELVFITLLNTLSTLFFSKDFTSLEDDGFGGGMKETIRRLMEIGSTPNLDDYYSILSGWDLQGLHKNFMECVKRLFASWDVIIKEKRESKKGNFMNHGDLLDVLLSNGFNNDQINYLLLDLFIAGTDTSTSTIEWLMTELIRNREIMGKISEEIVNEINGDTVRQSEVSHLSYLNACVKETLRLHCPIPIIPHHATETCDLMGYTIPKGTPVWVNIWAITRDPTSWENPLTFDPNRFLNSDLDFHGNYFEYLPFGSGRRMCPGVPFATKTIPLVIASLIYWFDWSLPLDMCPTKLDMNEKFGITLQKEQPLLLVPKVRKR
ncbi:hypothetical protein GIB67_040651 [Kingdonia uniflora]|uniref:Cytochrome P450 n=1 Tax=Kingdonia uniflora TaxID=39325 RepID=A0A7J7KU89_9MAGN|nr:hypothetical protein GIB67_040651 [Kingdonia uniflora]